MHKTSIGTIDNISVCICSYKRPYQLESLLEKLQYQNTDNLFTYSVIVIDNDVLRTAEEIVLSANRYSTINIEYYNMPEQNISLARNSAIGKSKGKYIAFIDDDEFPVDDWLLNLYTLCVKLNVDGVLGPVKPYFTTTPPDWIVRGKLLDRSSFPTGTLISDYRYTRTGNVLFRKGIFYKNKSPFNPVFGRTGGEDTDFFKRMIEANKKFAWCEEACVYETVPTERLKRAYFLKRALLRGNVTAYRNSINCNLVIKSLTAFIIYSTALPFLLIAGQHYFMKYLVKDCDHIGLLLGILRINPVRIKSF